MSTAAGAAGRPGVASVEASAAIAAGEAGVADSWRWFRLALGAAVIAGLLGCSPQTLLVRAAADQLAAQAGAAEDVAWKDAIEWAQQVGGELPTRQEQALLYANLKREFEADWYWSSEQYSDSDAWYQYFDDSSQHDNDKSYGGRARAVRRLAN